jgi:cell division protein FtsW
MVSACRQACFHLGSKLVDTGESYVLTQVFGPIQLPVAALLKEVPVGSQQPGLIGKDSVLMEVAPPRDTSHGITTLALAAILMAVGVVMVLSSEAGIDGSLLEMSPRTLPAVRQASFAGLGLGLMVILTAVPYRLYRWRPELDFQPALILLLVSCALVLVVYVPGLGVERNGARRWIAFGPLSFQPSEPAKLAMVLFLAAWLSAPGRDVKRFLTGPLPGAAAMVLVCGLIGLEDFGTAALLALVGGAMLVAAGCRWGHLGLLALPGAGLLTALLVGKSYRIDRLLSFRDVWADPLGATYHPLQSLCTIASGGWWGRGLGNSIQKYGYLPQGRSDFIFPLLCEELGVIGGVVVIILFLALLWQGRQAMVRSGDSLGRLLACGLTLLIGLQAAVNIAVVTVTVPTKGIALPFVSAGGTGLLVFCAAVGILTNIGQSAPAPPRTE